MDLTPGSPFGGLRWPLGGSRLWLALEESALGWILARMEGVPGDAEPPQGAEFPPLEGLYPASASGHDLGDCVLFPDGMLGFTNRALGTGAVVEGPTLLEPRKLGVHRVSPGGRAPTAASEGRLDLALLEDATDSLVEVGAIRTLPSQPPSLRGATPPR
ncbi:hypothetical protein Mtai_v1c18210 [Meiothermus taiwanensis WR-220]|uniref:Uncharacterized protein n=2 Tax=Meiothermus taiwanensis TaxID=172827 RepID=A0ABM6WIX7_9DEIN|nr:hypothetical protein Mtai_v1c18210 [Meiothermus taiwanensis WR-220]KIQ55425.1 hypothetical protein SY28_03285 [Meiothermus taiwanensis]KZK14830.1 hypothetical protein A3962_12410 [Meiothermus taiwanensis]